MFPSRLGPAVLQSQFDAETAGAHAAKSIRKHTDASHAAALALVEELLAIVPREEQPRATPVWPREEELTAGVAGE